MSSFDSSASRAWTPATQDGGDADGWEATRAQTALATQIMRSEDDYLAPEHHDIGRQTGADERELFVSCDPAQALQQQFEHLRPEFIAVHDIATSSSRKLLAGVAAASSRAVHKLVIRRQGYGNVLASLQFVELPTTDGTPLRMYSTEADADLSPRDGLARMLLAFSRLGVIMVGDLPPHSISAALKPFQDAMMAGPWVNRHLLLLPLMLPLISGTALAAEGTGLGRHLGLTVRTTPQVTRAADAWGYINSSWSRVREPGPSTARAHAMASRPTALGTAASTTRTPLPATPRPMDPTPAMRPMPAVGPSAARADASRNVLERYVYRLSELAGMVSCCVFDVATGLEAAHAGARPDAAELAMHGKALLAGMGVSSRALGLGHALPEAAITLGAHHLLLRALPMHPGLALHAVLDKTTANLTLARLQVQRMDAIFETAQRSH